jgi:DNA invertase Pin-like site-specific DNA recombinase
MKAIYARISTANQSFERQMQKEENVKVFIDVVSGTIPFEQRPEALKLMHDNEVTCIVVKEISRIGRNLRNILETLDYFTAKGIDIYIENQGLHTMLPNGKPNPTAMLIISILGTIAVQERELLLERTAEGIAIAKANGRYKGRKRGTTNGIEQMALKFQRTILYANELVKAGRSINYITNQLIEQNKSLPDANKFKGANRMTLNRLRELNLITNK